MVNWTRIWLAGQAKGVGPVVVRLALVYRRAATVGKASVIIGHCLPLPFSRQSVAVIVAECRCSIPAYHDHWVAAHIVSIAAANTE